MTISGGYPKVAIQEIDLSDRIPGFPGVYGGIVVPTKFGPIDVPVLCSTETNYLRNFSANERINIGDTLSHFSALAFLQKSDKLWVRRPIGYGYKYGGLDVKLLDDDYVNTVWAAGESIPSAHSRDIHTRLSIYQQNPGRWAESFYIRLWLQRNRENVVLGTNTVSAGPAAAASGVLRNLITITAKTGSAGNFGINLVEDEDSYGLAESTAISTKSTSSSLVGAYFTLSSTTTNYFVWFTVDGVGTAPTVAGATGVKVELLTGDMGLAVAQKIAVALSVIPGISVPTPVTNLVMVTNLVNGVVSHCTDGVSAPTTFPITVLVSGVDNSVSTVFENNVLTVGIVSGQTKHSAITAAISGFVRVNTAVSTTPTVAWTLSAGSNTVTLSGGAEDSNTIVTTQHWVSGEPVRLILLSSENGDTMPAGLREHVVYYTVGNSYTSIKLALSQANALNGVGIVDITSVGKGVMQIIPMKEILEPNSMQIEVYRGSNLNYPVETFICSTDRNAVDGFGRGIYVDEITKQSRFIRSLVNPMTLGKCRPQVSPLRLNGGRDGSVITDGEMMLAADAFANKGTYLLTVLMDGGWSTPAYQKHLDSIVSRRMDSVALLSTPYDKEVSLNYLNDLADYRRNILNLSSSYSALYSPHVKIYDKYNDRVVYVAPDGYAAASISYTAYNYELWYPAAGFRRGNVNALDCSRRFSDGELDYLYDNDINPLRFFPARGICIWGQKTLQGRASSLDRLNVRLMLIIIEPAIASALESFLFELNDDATRGRVASIITSYMETIKGRGGVYDFKVQCDRENNTDNDVDNHRLNVALYLKPTQAVEYINCTVVIMRTGMSFEMAADSIGN